MTVWTRGNWDGRYYQNYCQACAKMIAYTCRTCVERFPTPLEREKHLQEYLDEIEAQISTRAGRPAK